MSIVATAASTPRSWVDHLNPHRDGTAALAVVRLIEVSRGTCRMARR